MKKKFLALVMTLSMVLSLVPMTALATGDGSTAQTTTTAGSQTTGADANEGKQDSNSTAGGGSTPTGGEDNTNTPDTNTNNGNNENTGSESGSTGGTESGGSSTSGTEGNGSTPSGGDTEGGNTGTGGGTEGSGAGGGTVTETENAAKIGDTEYPTVADAMAAATPGDTIKLLKDITESVEVKVTKNFGGELTIDLNRYSVDGNSQKCIWRTGSSNCWPSKLIVKNGTLKNAGSGSAIEWEGDLEVVNCRFEKNQGGAIQSRSGNTTIVNSTFEENQSGNAAGAAIQLAANVKCTITGSAFSGNVTNNMGGAVYVDHGTLDITDCTFEKNSAGFGGAIAVNEIKELTIGNNTNCLDNKAASGGGAIYANIATNINIVANSALCNNIASGYGGGIYASASNINIAANSAVYNNTAATAGDDLFFFNNSTFTLPNAKDMSGDRILSSDKTEITGWYHDGWYKWNAAANDGQGGSEPIGRWTTKTADGYVDEYIPAEKDKPYITLKAAHPLMYTLTYDVTGDLPEGYTAPAKQTLVNGSSYTVADVPASVAGTKDGVNGTFSFNGWKKDDGTVLTGEQKLTADLTLHGVWTFTKKSSSGGHRPSNPTVTIPDDVPTGLNGKDHYAYVVGYPDGMVYPQKNITRAEVATIFFRLLEDETREANMTKSNSYNDMKEGAWYTCAVSTLSKMGIIKGYEDGSFKPDASISRAEFAAIAARFDPDGDKTPATFSDVSSHWAKDEISIAANHGWIKGYEDGSFKPDQKITRAETMTLVNRVLKRLPETKDDLHKDMKTWPDNQNESAWFYLAVQEATNSHYQKLKKDGTHETWESMRETRDWAALEK